MESKLMQRVQQGYKSSAEQRIALLEASLLQSMDTSLASNSTLAHRLTVGLQELRHSICQDQSHQVSHDFLWLLSQGLLQY